MKRWTLAVFVLSAGLMSGPMVLAGEPAAEAEEGAEPEVYNNTIRWATASEVDNFGFDVFRSESADGPFEKLNPQVLEGAGTTDEPTSYQWVDDTIDPRKAYYYYVESISMSGERELFTPVGRAKPKISSEESSADSDS